MGQTRQAKAPATQPFGAEAFAPSDRTVLRWLGKAGFLVNARGTTIMIDPLLRGFDMPIMIEIPLTAAPDVPHLDAVLVTHSDNDHYSVPTCRDLAAVTDVYHSTQYVAELMRDENLTSAGRVRLPPTGAAVRRSRVALAHPDGAARCRAEYLTTRFVCAAERGKSHQTADEPVITTRQGRSSTVKNPPATLASSSVASRVASPSRSGPGRHSTVIPSPGRSLSDPAATR
jgi:hypothetical protein